MKKKLSIKEKIILWAAKTGLTNLAWLAIAVAAWILMGQFWAGACLGIFVYINFNVISKLIYDLYEKL